MRVYSFIQFVISGTTDVNRAHAQSPVKDSQNAYVIVRLYTIKRYPHTTLPAAYN